MISKIRGRLAYRLRSKYAFRTRTVPIPSGTPTTLMKVHRGFCQCLETGAVPRLRQFVAGHPTQKTRINHGPVPVRVVVENVAVRRGFIRVKIKLQYRALKGPECYIKRKRTFRFQQFHQPTAVL